MKTQFLWLALGAALLSACGSGPEPMVMREEVVVEQATPGNVYYVFFDWDSDRITPEGQNVIATVAGMFQAGAAPVVIGTTGGVATVASIPFSAVVVVGHADRSGSASYNVALSQRRAEAVAERLIVAGVPRGSIYASGVGEAQPLVPTPDGVREPSNRRVELTLQ